MILVFPIAVITSFALLGAVWVVLRLRSISFVYGQDVNKDYAYSFEKSQLVQCRIEDGMIIIPAEMAGFETLLIGMHVRADWLGHLVEPHIECRAGEKSITHSFERGVNGKRFLDISSIAGQPGQPLTVTTHHTTCPLQEIALVGFSSGLSDTSRVMVMAAHPDDAELAAFGLYSRANAQILTVTHGEPGSIRWPRLYSDDRKSSRARARLRIWESLTVPLLGGVSPANLSCLRYELGSLARMYRARPAQVDIDMRLGLIAEPGMAAAPAEFTRQQGAWPDFAMEIRNAIAAANPTIIVTPHPLLDSNTDHRLCTMAVLEALIQLPELQGHLFLTCVHPNRTRCYPFGRRQHYASLPPLDGQKVAVDGIHSVSLDEEEISWKYVVLNTMSELRPLPAFSVFWLMRKHFRNMLWRIFTGFDDDYYRRFTKPNELFLVLAFDRAAQLLTECKKTF